MAFFQKKCSGEGFVFYSTESTLFSPIEYGTVKLITDTKHAIFFNIIKDINILMHIGLDTVKLKGKPFNVHVKTNEIVNISTKIIDVNFNLISKSKLNPACPITIDSNLWKFNFESNTTKVKKGDLIGEFVENIEVNLDTVKTYFNKKSKYEQIASHINTLVGGQPNYESVYNCITRLRFKIKNKSLVNEELLKIIPEIKGIIWNNEELQVVIGQDVYKVKDAITLENNNSNLGLIDKKEQKFKVKQTGQNSKSILGAIGGIMTPLIPVLVSAGMLMSLVSILQQSELMPHFKFINPNPSTTNAYTPYNSTPDSNTWYIFNNDPKGPQPPMGWALFFIISNCALKSLSIFACASTARYLNYNVPISTALGLLITAPGFLLDCTGTQFVLFHISGIPETSNFKGLANIIITGQGSCVLVAVATIFAAKYLDDWIKSWIPPSINLVFRPFSVMLIISMTALFILTPIWYVISTVIGGLINYTRHWYGIGVAIYALVWELFVALGINVALFAVVSLTEYTNSQLIGEQGHSFFWVGQSVGSWSQLGAVIAIAIITKDRKLRREAGSTIVTGLFGVTEPLIYGVTLPRVIPFITASIGAGLGGLFGGYMQCAERVPFQLGVFDVLGYFKDPSKGSVDTLSSVANGTFLVIACCISFGTAMGLTVLFYKERKEELNYVKKISNKLNNYILVTFKLDKKEIDLNNKTKIKEVIKKIKSCLNKNDIKQIKHFEKIVFTNLNLQDKINTIKENDNLIKNRLLIKGRKLVEKEYYNKAMVIMKEHLVDNIDHKVEIIINKLNSLNYEKTLEQIRKFAKIHIPINDVNELAKITGLSEIEKLIPNFTNALNSLLIDYKIDEPIEEFDLDYELSLKQLKLKEIKQQAKISK